MRVEATLKDPKWHDIAHWGIRTAIGITFIAHSIKKIPKFLQLPLSDLSGTILTFNSLLWPISLKIKRDVFSPFTHWTYQ